jgi:hypothetical protein
MGASAIRSGSDGGRRAFFVLRPAQQRLETVVSR